MILTKHDDDCGDDHNTCVHDHDDNCSDDYGDDGDGDDDHCDVSDQV